MTVSSETLTQFAVLDALLAGAYESGIRADEMLASGDFGIGCCEHLGGEVVILDGVAYQCTIDASPEPMAADRILPFVDVCPFGAVDAVPVDDVDLDGLQAAIDASLVSRNLFHAVRVDGRFSSVRTRVTPAQDRPAEPLAEVAAHQVETVLRDVAGTLVGFWSPAIYQGIAVAGLHLHFLADDRGHGGHVLDVAVGQAQLRTEAFARFELRLPTDSLFLHTELSHDDDHRIAVVEGGQRHAQALRQRPAPS